MVKWIHLGAVALTTVLLAVPCHGQELEFEATPPSPPPSTMPTSEKNPYLIEEPKPSFTAPPQNALNGPKTLKPFELQVTEERFLPPDMYGQWSVTATLIKTNVPGNLPQVVSDIWILDQDDNTVFISNPVTKAHTSISVDEVRGNTATFHHKVVVKEGRRVLLEQPTVTVMGDTLKGRTVHKYYTLRRGEIKSVHIAVFDIQAERLSGGKVRFGKNARELDFEVEDIQMNGVPDSVKVSPENIDSNLFVN